MAERHDLIAGGDEFLRLKARKIHVRGDQLEELGDRGFAAPFAGHRHVRPRAVDSRPRDAVVQPVEYRLHIAAAERRIRFLHNLDVVGFTMIDPPSAIYGVWRRLDCRFSTLSDAPDGSRWPFPARLARRPGVSTRSAGLPTCSGEWHPMN
jgi:hypothetical protein